MTTHTTRSLRMTAVARQELRTAVDQARRAALAAEKKNQGRYRGLMVTDHGLRGYKQGCKCEVCRREKSAYQHAYRARRGR